METIREGKYAHNALRVAKTQKIWKQLLSTYISHSVVLPDAGMFEKIN